MSTIENWDTDPLGNSSAAPDGAPELMPRSGVNDTIREIMASVKSDYNAPAWKKPFVGFVLNRIGSGTVWTLVDGGGKLNASLLMSVNQIVRMVQGGNTWVGHIVSRGYTLPTTSFTMEWQTDVSQNTVGPVSVGTIELWQKSGNIVFRNTGTAAEQVPRNADLDAHTQTAEASLDVGFLDGQTREQLAQSAARGRLNFNGDPFIWQRGTTFTSATVPNNDDGNVCADGYTIISNGNNRVGIGASADTPVGLTSSIRLEAVGSLAFGLIQPVEINESADVALSGVTDRVCGSLYAKFDGAATGIDSVRVYLLAIKAAAPGNPVAGWPPVNTNFTVGANWEIIASANITLTGSWQRFTPFTDVHIGAGTGTSGLALAFHTNEAAMVGGERFFVSGLQVNHGPKHLPFVQRPVAVEIATALRYCETTYDNLGPIGHNQGVSESLCASANALGDIALDWRFAVAKYKTPTLVTYNPEDAAPTAGENFRQVGVVNNDPVSSTEVSTRGAHIFATAGVNNALYRIAAYAHANIYGNS